ncbi:MAG: site-2 protease family protein [Candidatus Latescibacteria bacterium]|nr:site-2 protease family protein [Candidatus Latescibacterota bacterium]
MKWAFRLGTVAGIGLYLHGTFLILLAWVGISHIVQGHSIADAFEGMVFIIALFGCVVLHELGHALSARRYGISTRDITLLPIGGLARLERMPREPKQELVVALAGPAVNVVLAVVLFGVIVGLSGFDAFMPSAPLTLVGGDFLNKLLWVNVSLLVFNLLPAFPMDGGRVLRALLAQRMDYVRATKAAARIGQGMALLFGLVGLFSNPFLLFIALFVYIGATEEAAAVQMQSAFRGIPVMAAMVTNFRTLTPDDSLARAVEHLLGGCQQDFPVMEGNQVVGVLTRNDLLMALGQQGPEARVGDVMRRGVEPVDAFEMLETTVQRMRAGGHPVLPIVHGGALVGLLTQENIGEFTMIQAALQQAGRSARTPSLTQDR